VDLTENGSIAFLNEQGRMAEAIRTFDWRGNPLGLPGDWPPALRIAVTTMLASKFPSAIIWGPERITLYNDAYRPILGHKPEALGRPFHVVWAEVWDFAGPLVEKAYNGEATFIEDYPLIIDRYGHREEVNFTFCHSPIRDEAGRITGILDTVIETTAKVRAEKRNQLLNSELAHRVRNLLTVIIVIIDQTFRTSATKDDAKEALSKRIMALAEAQEILSRSSWNAAPIDAVVRAALSPLRGSQEQISITGPALDLTARQALSLALAVNELATNAMKYGALSCASGTISITWAPGAPDSYEPFRFIWRELGGPPVVTPMRKGFGSRLIERALAGDFGGEVRMDYAPEGLRCELTAPMGNLRATPHGHNGHANGHS
jgi:two-component sensor histidine kinase